MPYAAFGNCSGDPQMPEWTDGGDLAALRYGQWKLDFLEQRAHTLDVREEPFVRLRLPKPCAAIRSSAPTRRASATTPGAPSACSCWSRRRHSWRSGFRA